MEAKKRNDLEDTWKKRKAVKKRCKIKSIYRTAQKIYISKKSNTKKINTRKQSIKKILKCSWYIKNAGIKKIQELK